MIKKNTWQSWINRISVVILIGMICACYYLWLRGIGTPAKFDFYQAMPHYMAIAAGVVMLLNLWRLEKLDLVWLALAILSIIFYSYFSEIRKADFYDNTILAVIIVTVLDFKVVQFSQKVRLVLATFLSIILVVTVYRIFTELPTPANGDSIWKFTNKLSYLWLNTNTIGEMVMTAMILASCLFQSVLRKRDWIILFPLYLISLAGTWVLQSKAALLAVAFFIVFDLIRRIFKEKIRLVLMAIYCTLLVLIIPFSIFVAESDKVNVFTGREEIWRSFYHQLAQKESYMMIGMKPFAFYRNHIPLSFHSSYNAILGKFGIIGVTLITLFLIFTVGLTLYRKNQTHKLIRISFIIGFMAILLQATMENILVEGFWIPLTLSLLGFAQQNFEDATVARPEKIKKRDIAISTPAPTSRMSRREMRTNRHFK